MHFKKILLFDIYRSRENQNSHRKNTSSDKQKDRRHSHDNANKKQYVDSQPTKKIKANTHKQTAGKGQWKKSMEDIEREYDNPGCKFYQIYNPATKKYLQIYPENTSVGLTEDYKNFNSKYIYDDS